MVFHFTPTIHAPSHKCPQSTNIFSSCVATHYFRTLYGDGTMRLPNKTVDILKKATYSALSYREHSLSVKTAFRPREELR